MSLAKKLARGEVWVVYSPDYGDTGKGKITDTLTEDERVSAVVRFQGGANAGHEVVVNGKSTDVHCLPSGLIGGRRFGFSAVGSGTSPYSAVVR